MSSAGYVEASAVHSAPLHWREAERAEVYGSVTVRVGSPAPKSVERIEPKRTYFVAGEPMPRRVSLITIFLAAAIASSLVGCGNALSPPGRAFGENSSNAEIAAAQRYAGASSAFVEVASQDLAKADRVGSCGVDQINEQTAFLGVPLDHTGMGTFVGWAGDTDSGSVPPEIEVVLVGPAGNFAVPARTGIARPDVAANTGVRAFAASGFKTKADMDGVPIGDYEVEISMQRAGMRRFCPTKARVSVQ